MQLRHLLGLALLPTLAGCFTIASTITVRPDGTGTLRDVVEVSGVGALALEEEDGGKDGLIDKARLRARAAALGEGVTLVGVEESETGYTAIYSFSDVRTLRYGTPDLPLSEDDGDKTVADDAFDLLFDFESGDPATLRITVPDEGGPTDDAPDKEMTAEEQAEAARALEFMRALLGEARMSVEVVLDGDVVETDAAFAEGSTITLVDFSFDDLFDVMEEHPELMGSEAPPTDQLQSILAGREGIALQPPGVVTVRFE